MQTSSFLGAMGLCSVMGGILSHGGTPILIHDINHPAIKGYPHDYGNHHLSAYWVAVPSTFLACRISKIDRDSPKMTFHSSLHPGTPLLSVFIV